MIYLLEDDESIRNMVVYALNNSGLETKGFERPSQFWTAVNENAPRLVLLDVMLPEEDGISVLKKLREKSDVSEVPVVMLTAKGSEYDKVKALDGGADDYIVKPFGIMELISRVKAILRRTEKKKTDEEIFTCGDIVLEKESCSVTAGGEPVLLTVKEFDLLALLIKRPGRVYTRDHILETIWGYSFDGENRTVDVHIRSLRVKLGQYGYYVKTVRGKGYKIDSKREVNEEKDI